VGAGSAANRPLPGLRSTAGSRCRTKNGSAKAIRAGG
jgi:hypothetical protein